MAINKEFYYQLSKSRFGNGTMVAAVFQFSRGGIVVMMILGIVGVYHWMN
jgi:hypothetical protein